MSISNEPDCPCQPQILCNNDNNNEGEGEPSDFSQEEFEDSKWSSVDSLVKRSDSVVHIEDNDCSGAPSKPGFFTRVLRSLFLCQCHSQPAHHNFTDFCEDIQLSSKLRSADRDLLSRAFESISLLQTFIEGQLLPKLVTHLEQIHYPGSPSSLPLLTVLRIPPIQNHSLSLPSAQAWIATYLVKLMWEQNTAVHCIPDNFTLEEVDLNGNSVLNLNPLRIPFISLCWEMEGAKKVGHQFYLEFEEFAHSINGILTELRVILMTSDLFSELGLSNEQLSLQDNSLELSLKHNKQKDKNGPIVLQVESGLNLKSPLSLSIVNKDGVGFTNNLHHNHRNSIMPIPKDFSKLSPTSKQKMVTDLLKSVTKSVESLSVLLSSSMKGISSKGIIQKCPASGKPLVTFHGALKKVKGILGKLLATKTVQLGGLEESDLSQLSSSILHLFQKWNEYVICGQCLILKFFELCDMIGICYSFAHSHLNIQIPEWGRLQKEVDLAMGAQTRKMLSSCRCQCGMSKLKNYVISNLIDECNKKMLEEAEDTPQTSSSSQEGRNKWGKHYRKQILSTWYPIVLQQSPIEMEDLFGKYEVIVRACPDLERVESCMRFNTEAVSLPINQSFEEKSPNDIVPNAPITFDTFKLRACE